MINKTTFFTAIFMASALFSQAFAQDKTESKKPEKPLKIDVEAGATFAKGNTREESIYSKNNLKYIEGKWTEIFKTRLENTKVNEVRAKERYDVNNQIRYNFNKKNFRLFEVEYVDDRFGGYDYRASETYGYGRNIIDKKDMKLSLQAGAGSRQTKFINGDKDFTVLARFGGHFDWDIKDGISFSENLDISIDQDVVITKSDTSFKIALEKVHDSVYLKIGYFIENRSDTPQPGIKKTDSLFMTTVGYSY